MANLGISGLSSGINSSDIIDSLIQADRAGARVLENRRTTLSARLDAVRAFNTRLLTAQVDISDLKRASTFTTKTVTSSDATALTATANSSAAPGSYAIEVVKVAQAEQLATLGVDSATASRGTGTVTIQIGSGAQVDVAIGAGESSLNGIANAINKAQAGVTASVVNDGEANPYRLVLQSSVTGTEGSINITVSDDNPGDGLDLAALFDNMDELTAGTNAIFKIGTGANAIEVQKSSNTVSDLVPGLTLTASKASTGPVTLTVKADTETTIKAVQEAVDSVNAAITYLNDNSRYDAKTGQAGILIGESALRIGLNRVVASLTGSDSGAKEGFRSLGALGITIDKTKGTLKLDKDVLTAKLAQDSTAVAGLFSNSGTSTVAGVEFTALTDQTKVKSHAFAVTVAPAQAKVATTGSIPVDGLGKVTINGANNTLSLQINGRSVNATLAAGSYTRDELAAQVQTAINAQSPTSKVTATISGTSLDLRTANYGSAQTMLVTGGTAKNLLGLSGTLATGADVQGTIGGVAATGKGQILSGADGTDAAGLKMLVTATAPVSGSMAVRKGLAQRTGDALNSLTDADRGSLVQKQDTLETSIEGLTKQIDKTDLRLADRRKRYEAQFLQMEKAIASLKNQEGQLNGQILAFQNAAAARANG